MAKSRVKKSRTASQGKRDRGQNLAMTNITPPPASREEVRREILALAEAGAAAFPETIKGILGLLKRHPPEALLSNYAFDGLQMAVGPAGTRQNTLGVQQHQAEILQALMLTLPVTEWGTDVLVTEAMETLYNEMTKLPDQFAFRRFRQTDEEQDNQTKVIQSIQERMRLHTQSVRNWGYYEEVIQISKALYSPLDEPMRTASGFGISDVIDVSRMLVKLLEERSSERFGLMRTVFREKTPKRMMAAYEKILQTRPSDSHSDFKLPPGLSKEVMRLIIKAHIDLRLPEHVTFLPTEVADLVGMPTEHVEGIFRALAMKPGDLKDEDPERFFLTNPVWSRPAMDLGGRFFIPLPQAIFSHMHLIVKRLADEAGIAKQFDAARASYLETKVAKVFSRALPDATVLSGVKWRLGKQKFETDVVVLTDSTLIIAEAKSHRLTPQALRGAPDRVKHHVRDLIVDPSKQADRLQKLVERARVGDAVAIEALLPFGFEPSEIDTVIRLSITLDDFSVLTAAERDLKEAGWIPEDLEISPTITIADLVCITDILGTPIPLLHYLHRRSRMQKDNDLWGDELDFLGLYLSSGFRQHELEPDAHFIVTNMSKPIDNYYQSRDAGIKTVKPAPRFRRYYQSLLDRLTEMKKPKWTTIGLTLLDSAGYDEQRKLEVALEKLRSLVSAKSPKEVPPDCLVMRPSENDRTAIVFYAYSDRVESDLKHEMALRADQEIVSGTCDDCIVIARCIERWDKPFEAILTVGRKPEEEALG